MDDLNSEQLGLNSRLVQYHIRQYPVIDQEGADEVLLLSRQLFVRNGFSLGMKTQRGYPTPIDSTRSLQTTLNKYIVYLKTRPHRQRDTERQRLRIQNS